MTLILIFVAIVLAKAFGVPGIKNIPWAYFLLLPLLWAVIKLVWPVFRVVGMLLFSFVAIDFMCYVLVPSYHMLIFGVIGSFFQAMFNAI